VALSQVDKVGVKRAIIRVLPQWRYHRRHFLSAWRRYGQQRAAAAQAWCSPPHNIPQCVTFVI